MKNANIYESIRELRELVLIANNAMSCLNVHIDNFYKHYNRLVTVESETLYNAEKKLLLQDYEEIRSYGLLFFSYTDLPTLGYFVKYDEDELYNEIVRFHGLVVNYKKEHYIVYEL